MRGFPGWLSLERLFPSRWLLVRLLLVTFGLVLPLSALGPFPDAGPHPDLGPLPSFGLLPAFGPGLAFGYEPPPLTPVEVGKLSRTAEETETFWDFLSERTEIGVGFDEIYETNLLLQDNNKQDDFLSIPEVQIFFADPRGSILYGINYEVNLYRYHKLDRNAIDHDLFVFYDYDPGGRWRIRTNYDLDVDHRLVFGPKGIDILRRSSDFQRSVEHTWQGKFRYALNETNNLVQQASYSIFDDQVVDDANGDRKRWNYTLDLDHDLTPLWVFFAGYEFDRVLIPGNKLKNSSAHAGRFGLRYEASEVGQLDATFRLEEREFKDGTSNTNLTFEGKWGYHLGPRTLLNLSYADTQAASFAAGRRRFRSRRPSIEVQYELTPLMDLIVGADYEKQRSGGQDVLTGQAATAQRSSRYNLKAEGVWQVREEAKLTLGYQNERSKTADYTNHTISLAFEMEI